MYKDVQACIHGCVYACVHVILTCTWCVGAVRGAAGCRFCSASATAATAELREGAPVPRAEGCIAEVGGRLLWLLFVLVLGKRLLLLVLPSVPLRVGILVSAEDAELLLAC
eukprot:1161628-Pelagomonas_calceolata.AAC.4